MHGDARRCRFLAGRDVDVVKDLEMVGEELQWHDQHLSDPRIAISREEVLHVGREPLLGRMARTLVREAPARPVEIEPVRDRSRGAAELGDVPGIAVDDGAGKAVRGEDDRNAVAHSGFEMFEGFGRALRERRDPLRDQVPGAGDADVDIGMCGGPGGDRSLVPGEDDRRVLRRQHHDHDARRTAGRDGIERIRDRRLRVQHPCDHHRLNARFGVEQRLKLASLVARDVDQRGSPDEVVAAPELLDQIRGHLSPAAHRAEIGRDVIGGHSGAEGGEHHAELGHAG